MKSRFAKITLCLALVCGGVAASAQTSFMDTVKQGQSEFIDDAEQRARQNAANAQAARQGNLRGFASNRDFYNACLGMTQYPTNCYDVQNKDLKNLCLATSTSDYRTFCYDIGNTDVKNACLGMTDYPSSCYDISDPEVKNTCLARSNRDYSSFCLNIDSGPWRAFCGGVAMNKDNCFLLN